MAGVSLLTLLDDIAMLLDDVIVLSKVVAKNSGLYFFNIILNSRCKYQEDCIKKH